MPEEVSNQEFGAIALYAFMGWLTSRTQVSGPFSALHSASAAAELVNEFCKSQDWEIKSEDWLKYLKDYPAQ
jgi:hypothetical protein